MLKKIGSIRNHPLNKSPVAIRP